MIAAMRETVALLPELEAAFRAMLSDELAIDEE